jgi:hypothetical protein
VTAVVLAALAASGVPAQADPTPLLPDLIQEVPTDLNVKQVGNSFQLGFTASTANIGAGPLLITGSRPSTAVAEMSATQTVEMSDGSTPQVHDGVGVLRYVTGNHNHWHLLGFEHYELRKISDYSLVAPDSKTGFCMGDTRRLDPPPPDSPTVPMADPSNSCSLNEPNVLTTSEGLSVGWIDDYLAYRDGQYIDITGVPSGLYYLVHRADPSGQLFEQRYDNNNSSLLLSLTWPNGMTALPKAQSRKECPGSDMCPPDPPAVPPADPAPPPTTEPVSAPPDDATRPPVFPVAPALDSTFYVLSTRALDTGQVRLKAQLPGSGTLTAVATTPKLQVGTKTVRVTAEGTRTLTFTPRWRMRPLLRRPQGLSVLLRVTYTRTGAQPRTLRLRVTLKRH